MDSNQENLSIKYQNLIFYRKTEKAAENIKFPDLPASSRIDGHLNNNKVASLLKKNYIKNHINIIGLG